LHLLSLSAAVCPLFSSVVRRSRRHIFQGFHFSFLWLTVRVYMHCHVNASTIVTQKTMHSLLPAVEETWLPSHWLPKNDCSDSDILAFRWDFTIFPRNCDSYQNHINEKHSVLGSTHCLPHKVYSSISQWCYRKTAQIWMT
jgi:hypothetical protein